MFEYASFVMRNPSFVTKNVRKQWSVRKALLAHRKQNPVCAATGATTRLEVHHNIPVSVAPELADAPENLTTLTKWAHFAIGHACDYKAYVANVVEVCESMQIQRTKSA